MATLPKMTKILSVVGARPQFVKLAPIAEAFRDTGVVHSTVHTGQHYDHEMSAVFFEELGIGEPEWNLGVGSGSHGSQTGAMLSSLDSLFAQEKPDWVLVYGDTNSTIAAALAAVKLHFPVAHLEAGLRSFNRKMPEEHNRVLTDHASDLLLAPTQNAADQLNREGLGDRTVVVGDVMIDVLLDVERSLPHNARPLPESIPVGEEYVLATIHRAENTDDPDRLRLVIGSLAALPVPVILPVHPRLRGRSTAASISLGQGSLIPVDPLSYRQMVAAVKSSRSVITDSGGLQKEAVVLGVPVTTLRTETEWVETLTDGWNVLAPNLENLSELAMRLKPGPFKGAPYGTGNAAQAVVEALTQGA